MLANVSPERSIVQSPAWKAAGRLVRGRETDGRPGDFDFSFLLPGS